MSDTALIHQELQKLEQVQAELALIATRTDDRRRHDLVQLRRKLSDQIARVDQAVSAFILAHSPDIARPYRAIFSRMRSVLAQHQGTWPAVRIDEDAEQYRESLSHVHDASRDWVAWIKDMVTRSDRRS